MSIIERKGVVFGFLAGLWIMFLGAYIILDGIQWQSGIEITTVGNVQTAVFVYSEIVSPFSSYSTMWAVPFILVGIYICYLASRKRKESTV